MNSVAVRETPVIWIAKPIWTTFHAPDRSLNAVDKIACREWPHISKKMNEKIMTHLDLHNVMAHVLPDNLSDSELLNLYLAMSEEQREKKFASTWRAAKIAGLSQRTIQSWVESGFVKAVIIGRKYQVSLDSLKLYLKSRAHKSA